MMMGFIIQALLKMEKDMEKVKYMIKMGIYYMMEISSMIHQKEMGKEFMKMEHIMLANLKREKDMEKEFFIITKIQCLAMKGILWMINLMDKEN